MRSRILSALAVAHWLLAAVFLYAFLLALIRLGGGRPHTPASISIGPAVSAIFLLVFALIGRGMWRGKLWGQWLAIVVVGLCVASLGYALYDDGDWDRDLLPAFTPFAALLVAHLLPCTWRALRVAKLESPSPTI